MNDPLGLGLIALFVGFGVAVALLIPFIAVSYRRRGRLTFWRSLGWLALLVYFCAIWTYTMLPLPASMDYRCVGYQLHPFATMDDIRAYGVEGLRQIARNTAFQQVVLNVLLFMPLGFLLRSMFRRGIIVSFLVGFTLSLLIETTQLTGVWGLFPCAYRLFDVDDIITNTTGAVLGSIVALILFLGRGGNKVDPAQPQRVTAGRRFLGVFSDVFIVSLLGSGLALGWRAYQMYVERIPGPELPTETNLWLSYGVPAALQLLVVLVSGRTLGEHVVLLAPRYGAVPVFLARILRYLAGIGGYMLLTTFTFPLSDLLGFALVVVTIVLIFATPDRRGFAGLVSGTSLIDARELATSRRD